MRRRKRMVCLIAAGALLLAACSDSSTDSGGSQSDPSASASPDERSAGKGDAKKNERKEGDGKTSGRRGRGRGDDDPGEKDQASDGSSPALFPAAGDYSYGQEGYEEFCQGAACDRRDLPPAQTIETSLEDRSGESAVVVTDARSSDGRETRTTTRYTRDHALITEVYTKVNYSGFEFSNTYKPKPPVESLRFPLRDGNTWSGTWKAQTSGDYRMEVVTREGVTIGGRAIQAYRLSTVMHFRGEFDGTADITVWIDPATKAIVKTRGRLDVDSDFGSYHTKFDTQLSSGPGY